MAGRIEDQIHYDPVTGVFTWEASKPRIRKGSRAGGLTERGYRKIRINGKKYFEHRLAFYLVTGEWPTDQVDHINGTTDDNRWINLREASNGQNQWNAKPYSSTGVKGVYKVGDKYRVKGHLDQHLCYTDDFDLACILSTEHREKHGEGFARTR